MKKKTAEKTTNKTIKKKTALYKKKTALYIVLIGALLSIGAVLLFYSLYALYDLKTMDVFLQVGDTQGFDVDTERVSFGKLMPGTSASRDLVVSHEYSRPLRVIFRVDGNVSRFVRIPDQFWLNSSEIRTVGLTAFVPLNQSKGVYTGTLKVTFRRI